ncbi:hypothetical protein NFI96_004638 [Prochilodus magdalenae]|nr:hypothetical protein NFI96_004638 [Prochilodus magdalenae]
MPLSSSAQQRGPSLPSERYRPRSRLEREPSAAPREIRCVSPSSSSLLVSWRPPPEDSQNGDLTGYELRYQAIANNGTNGTETLPEKTIRTEASASQARLKNLAKWRRYRVLVAALTGEGPGPESAPLECRTDEDVPGAPPSQMEVQPLNSTSIRVSWRSVKPDQRNGQIRGYQVHYALLENGESRGLPRIRDIMLDDAQWKTDDAAEYVSMAGRQAGYEISS